MARKAGVYGGRELQAALRAMAKTVGRPVNEASRFALQPVLKSAKANTRHESVRRALVLKRDTKAPKDVITHAVGGDPKNPDYRLLHLLEFGTEPHVNAGQFPGTRHPGTAAQPFLSPAWEAEAGNVIERFGQKLGPAIERQAARLAKKGVR